VFCCQVLFVEENVECEQAPTLLPVSRASCFGTLDHETTDFLLTKKLECILFTILFQYYLHAL
jgi:hypothetical protein